MRKIIVDGGSTKVTWVLTDDDKEIARCTSKGINPSLLSYDDLIAELQTVISDNQCLMQPSSIEYYGAGCTPAASPVMQKALQQVFAPVPSHSATVPADSSAVPTAVTVGSDIIGAAKALLGSEEGIACILGTGANSCLWDGHAIVRQTPALGYVLGDEGSGAVLGKLLLNALYKGTLPSSLRKQFEQEYGLDMMGVIEHVYRQPQPNRWLASLSPFVARNIHEPQMEALVMDNLEAFIVRNILPYGCLDLPVSFVGSIAYYYEQQLRAVAMKHDVIIGKIMQNPL